MPSLLLMLLLLSWLLDLFTLPKNTRFGIPVSSFHKMILHFSKVCSALNHSNSAQAFGPLLPLAWH
jgi:hypothetical protein